MIHALEPRIRLEYGTHARVLTLAELARALGLSGREAHLRSLLLASCYPQAVHGEGKPTEGMRRFLSPRNETIDINSFPDVGEGWGSGGNHGGPSPEQLANELSDQLSDHHSLPFYRLVAVHVPAEVIRDALLRALEPAPRDIRRSRAAYFTALVRPHLPRRRRGQRPT
jgi:hypothetical protein